MTRSMLIHANRRWNSAITTNLWPYAMRIANDILNEKPNMQDKYKQSSEQIFSKSMVNHNTKHQRHLDAPYMYWIVGYNQGKYSINGDQDRKLEYTWGDP